MSGVEVAGLVLGCLPLIIQGIESYNEGLDPIKSFLRWEKELPSFIRKLRNQHVHYAQTIRILIEPITTEFELAEMLSNPSGELWKDKEMAEKLQDRLQDSYYAYQSTIADIERITRKIASKLDLERATELTRDDLEAMLAANPKKSNDRFEFKKKVKFAMGKKAIKALLEELDDCNKELERFTDKSEKIETFRKTIKPSFAKRLQRIQRYAASLHETLSVCWSCSCKSYHKTSLQLDQRGSLYANGLKKANPSPKTCFKVSFLSSSEDIKQLWTWQAAEIVVDDEDEKCVAFRPVSKPKMTKSVSFGDKPPPPYSPTDPATTLTPSLQEIHDLCASIQRLYKSSPCIGFSFDSKYKLRGAYPVDTVAEQRVASCEFVTLEELLNRPPVVNGRSAKLSKKERYSLAVTLASSTLQLNSTPWFPDQWASKDILFNRTCNSPRLIDIDHPYVAPKLAEVSGVKSNGHTCHRFHNKNTILLALAVALLELYFGISAEKHRELESRFTEGQVNPWTLCAMAYEWADEEQENLSAAFSTAVSHCLRCFNDPGASLQDAEFLQAAVECIVLPLQDELYQFLGKSRP